MLNIVRLFTINISVQSYKNHNCYYTYGKYYFNFTKIVNIYQFKFYLHHRNHFENNINLHLINYKFIFSSSAFCLRQFSSSGIGCHDISSDTNENVDNKLTKKKYSKKFDDYKKEKLKKELKKMDNNSRSSRSTKIFEELLVLKQQKKIIKSQIKSYKCNKKYSKDDSDIKKSINNNNNDFKKLLKLRKCFSIESIENSVAHLRGKDENDKKNQTSSENTNLNDDFNCAKSELSSLKIFKDSEEIDTEKLNICKPQNVFNTLLDSERSEIITTATSAKKLNIKDNRTFEEQKLSELREYEFTARGTGFVDEPYDKTEEKFHFLVMSYNILSQNLLESNMGLYREHNPAHLNWNFRSKQLMKEFTDNKPDIICLQEVEESDKPTFFDQLEKIGYQGIYKKRTGDKTDGCAIYFNKTTFQLVDYTTVEFQQPGISLLDRDNIAIIAKLHPKGYPNYPLVIATTHLLYNPRRHDVKLAQTVVLLAELERLAFKGRGGDFRYYPVILTGDFNLEPFTGVYQLLVAGFLDYESLDTKKLFYAAKRVLSDKYYPSDIALGPPIGKQFLPPSLGITDNCEHFGIVDTRTNTDLKLSVQDSLIGIYNSDRQNVPKKYTECEKMEESFRTGTLKNNNFDFYSVYYHEDHNNITEATTKHNEWVSVDYMFYTPLQDKRFKHNQLQLVKRRRLPNIQECQQFLKNIPNRACPSDHLPLLAGFFLRVKKS